MTMDCRSTLDKYLANNGIEWYKDFNRDILVLILPCGTTMQIDSVLLYDGYDPLALVQELLEPFELPACVNG